MKRIFIHIGTHKTGSTSIKSSLASNKKMLKKHGLLYLDTKWSYDIMRITEPNDIIKRKIKKNFVAQLEKENPNKKYDVVIAAEKFSGNPYTGYSNAALIANILSAISEGYQPMVIVYLRRQDTFIESLYTQSIHQGSGLSFPDFLSQREFDNYNWLNLLNAYEQVFGSESVKVRSYDYFNKNRANGGILRDFYQIIGYEQCFDNLSVQTRTDINIGYSPSAVHFATIANKYVDEDNLKTFRKALQSSNHKKKGESYTYFQIDERLAFLERYNFANTQIANTRMPEEQKIYLYSIIDKFDSIQKQNEHEILVEVIAKYILYNENKSSAEPKEIIKNVVKNYFPRLFSLISKKQ